MSELSSSQVPISFISAKVGEDLLPPCDVLGALIKSKVPLDEIKSHSNDLKNRMDQLTAPWWKDVAAQVDTNLKEMISEFQKGEIKKAMELVKQIRLLIERTKEVVESSRGGQRAIKALGEWQIEHSTSHRSSGAEQLVKVDEIMESFKALNFSTKDLNTLKTLSQGEGSKRQDKADNEKAEKMNVKEEEREEIKSEP